MVYLCLLAASRRAQSVGLLSRRWRAGGAVGSVSVALPGAFSMRLRAATRSISYVATQSSVETALL